ncbi:MAG: tetratricopeptide repeat protein [Bacteroidota bacterium]
MKLFYFRTKILITLTIIACAVMVSVFCGTEQNTTATNTSPYLNHNDTVKYVGMQQCRACHEGIYKTFIETGMGKSFDLATKQKSSADFSKHHVVYDKFKNLYYHPYWQNNNMYIMEFRLKGKDTIYKRAEKVDYIIGSGQHTNSHLMNINGYVYQMPLTWYAQEKKWDLPPGFEGGKNSGFNRSIEFECMSCHNAMPAVTDYTANQFVSVPNGIDCERCHGPGEAHVKDKLANHIVDTAHEIDYTIVNPRKLPWERQIDVCQRCHLQGNAVLKPEKTFRDFRPGMQLSDFWDVYMPKQKDGDESLIMASHAQRLQLSKCFIEGNKNTKQGDKSFETLNLTCITCHNPHVSVKKTGTQIFNTACINCHNEPQETKCTETEKVRMVSNNNCVQCHMPRSGTIDIPHVTVHDHWIKKPAKQKEIKSIEEFAGLYCINNKKTTELSQVKGLINYVEKFEGKPEALQQAATYFKNDYKQNDWLDAQIHLHYLQADYNAIIAKASFIKVQEQTSAWLCYRVGQAFQSNNDFVRAELFYQKAVDLSPSSIDFIDKLGQVKIQLNKLEEAIKILQGNLLLNAKQANSLTNLGFAYIKQGNTALAKTYYRKALQLNPDYEQALFNLAAVYNMEGNTAEAKKLLQQIMQLNPGNSQVKQLLETL